MPSRFLVQVVEWNSDQAVTVPLRVVAMEIDHGKMKWYSTEYEAVENEPLEDFVVGEVENEFTVPDYMVINKFFSIDGTRFLISDDQFGNWVRFWVDNYLPTDVLAEVGVPDIYSDGKQVICVNVRSLVITPKSELMPWANTHMKIRNRYQCFFIPFTQGIKDALGLVEEELPTQG